MGWRDDEVVEYASQASHSGRSSWRDDEVVEYASQASHSGRSSWRDDEVVEYAPGQRPEEQRSEYTEEDRRQGQLRANREMLAAQAHRSVRDSNWPAAKAAMINIGAGIVSPVARAIGKGDYADQMNRFSGEVSKVREEINEGGLIPDVLQRGVWSATESLGTMIPAVAMGGWPAAIVVASGQQGNESLTEGKDAGLEGAELAGHVARQATIEAAPALIMQRMGMGGLESVVGGKQAVASGLKAGLKQAGKAMAQELPEELVTEIAHSAESALSGVEPDALSAKNIKQTVIDTTVATMLSVGAASSPGLAASRKQGKIDKVRDEIIAASESDRAPSVQQWKKWGFPPMEGRSRAERMAAVKEMAAGIKEADAALAQSEAAPLDSPATLEAPQEAVSEPVAQQSEMAPPTPSQPTEQTPAAPVAATDSTSIANEPVNEQRALRGEEALPTPEPETHEQWLERGKQMIGETPMLPNRLVAEVLKAPRTLSPEETAVLTVHYESMRGELGAASKALFDARESGDAETVKRAGAEADKISQEMRDLENASNKSGTLSGRSLAARKLRVKRDFSLGSVVQDLRVSKGGRQLSEAEIGEAKEISEKGIAAEAKLAEVEARTEVEQSEAAVDRLLAESKRKKGLKGRAVAKTVEARKRVSDAMAEFKAQIAKKKPIGGVGQFAAGEGGALDLELVASGANLVKAYADLGVSTFAEFFANVRTQLGPTATAVRDSLKAAWANAQNAGLISKPDIDPSNRSEVNKFARKIARSVVESGVTNRDEVVSAVHEELQAILPEITQREAMDAISGYGVYSELSKDEVSATIRDINGQLRQLAKLEDMRSGQAPKKTGVEHRTQSDEELQLAQQVREAMKAGGFGVVDDAAKTAKYKKSLTKRIADLERRIAEGDFSKPVTRKTKLDEEATALKYQAKMLRGRLDAMEDQFRNSQKKGLKKLAHYAGEASNLSRATKTSLDLSALLRQGKMALGADPRMAVRATRDMLRAFWSKELAFNDAEAIRTRPKAREAHEAGLSTTDPDGKLTEQEEAFRGEWSKYIPGVAGSERAYVAGLNALRSSYYDALTNSVEVGNAWRKAGQTTAEERKNIANLVNTFTGRGGYSGDANAASQFLSTYLFSPRFVASRFQIAAGRPMWGSEARVRKLAAEQYAKAIMSMAAMYSLATVGGYFLMGDDDQPVVEWDPRSSEFLKIRFGEHIVDVTAGVAQVFTISARVLPAITSFTPAKLGLMEQKHNYTKTNLGEIIPISGPDVPFKGLTTREAMVRFLQYKIAPLPSALINAAAEENAIGQPTNLGQELLELPVPLSLGDVYDALQIEGLGAKAALSGVAILGDGVSMHQNATPDRFAKRISRSRSLRGRNEKTGETFTYVEAVSQIIAEAKKRGMSEGELVDSLVKKLRKEGRKPETIRDAKKRLSDRFRGGRR